MVKSRIWFTPAQQTELWERWKRGQSISAISRALERRNKTGVQRIVALHGGIAPLPRHRAASALRLEEREEISRGIAAGRSIRCIARALERAPSTICREIVRNGGLRIYRAARADKQAWERALRPKRCRLALHGRLRWRVAQKLALQWSPQQIAGWLKRQYPDDPGMRISHEAIYRSLFIQSRGVLKKELMEHLRTRRQMRHAKGAKTGRGMARSSTWCRSASARPKPRTGPSRVIGRAICSPAPMTRTSPRWSSGIAGSRCW